MSMEAAGDVCKESGAITGLLRRWRSGDETALEELAPKVLAHVARPRPHLGQCLARLGPL